VLIQSCGSLKPALIPLIDLVKLFRNFEGSNALVAMYISYSKKLGKYKGLHLNNATLLACSITVLDVL
jgi:hypothetical protein